MSCALASRVRHGVDGLGTMTRLTPPPGLGPAGEPRGMELTPVHTCTAIVERCRDTGLYVGYVPGFPGAHSQGDTLDELNDNLREVIAMLLDDGEPMMEGEYVGTQTSS